jgi:hypothetical protein
MSASKPTKQPRATASPCDEEDEHGNMVRTWDVCLGPQGPAIRSGFRTRLEARAAAAEVNAERATQARVSKAIATVNAKAEQVRATEGIGPGGVWMPKGSVADGVKKALALRDAETTADVRDLASPLVKLQPWHVETTRAVLRLKADGDADITDEQVEAAYAVIEKASDR